MKCPRIDSHAQLYDVFYSSSLNYQAILVTLLAPQNLGNCSARQQGQKCYMIMASI